MLQSDERTHAADIPIPGDFFSMCRYLFLRNSRIFAGGTLMVGKAWSFEPTGKTMGSGGMAAATEGLLVPSEGVTGGMYVVVGGRPRPCVVVAEGT